jgi:hypothetical protein
MRLTVAPETGAPLEVTVPVMVAVPVGAGGGVAWPRTSAALMKQPVAAIAIMPKNLRVTGDMETSK